MAMDDIHAAVEKKVGAPVARSSVRSYLNLNVTNGVFERVQRPAVASDQLRSASNTCRDQRSIGSGESSLNGVPSSGSDILPG